MAFLENKELNIFSLFFFYSYNETVITIVLLLDSITVELFPNVFLSQSHP